MLPAPGERGYTFGNYGSEFASVRKNGASAAVCSSSRESRPSRVRLTGACAPWLRPPPRALPVRFPGLLEPVFTRPDQLSETTGRGRLMSKEKGGPTFFGRLISLLRKVGRRLMPRKKNEPQDNQPRIDPSSGSKAEGPLQKKPTWTVLLYLAGDNDLAEEMVNRTTWERRTPATRPPCLISSAGGSQTTSPNTTCSSCRGTGAELSRIF